MLNYIERNYGCVAEYNRCRQEDEEHEWQLEMERQDWYKRNKEKVDKAVKDGTLVSYSWNCVGCPYYTSIGPTWSDDDIEKGICGNLEKKDCDYRRRE